MEVSVGSCCHDFITVMTHCRSPSGPIRARPMNPTPWQILSDPAQAQSDSPIHQDVSIASDLCLCLEILCISFSMQTSIKMLQTHTLWFMTDRRRMATFNVFSVQITMWTRDEFRLCHQEWTSRRWVIFKSCHLTNLLSCRRFSESKTTNVASYCFICPAGLLLHYKYSIIWKAWHDFFFLLH